MATRRPRRRSRWWLPAAPAARSRRWLPAASAAGRGRLPPGTDGGAYDSGMPGGAPPPFPTAAPPRNNKALIALVTGIAGIVFGICCGTYRR